MGYEKLFDLSLVLRMMDQNYELKNWVLVNLMCNCMDILYLSSLIKTGQGDRTFCLCDSVALNNKLTIKLCVFWDHLF